MKDEERTALLFRELSPIIMAKLSVEEWISIVRLVSASIRSLPAEPPEGCVRVRALVTVYADGTWSATGSSGWGAAAEKYHAASAQKHGGRVSFATFDASKPEPAAEIVAVAEHAP